MVQLKESVNFAEFHRVEKQKERTKWNKKVKNNEKSFFVIKSRRFENPDENESLNCKKFSPETRNLSTVNPKKKY